MSHDACIIEGAYLDNAATTPVAPEVLERMEEVMRESWGNPSSLHSVGFAAKDVLEESRAIVAGALGVDAKELYFTSGATESNNLAIRGACMARRKNPGRIITSTLEHASVTRSVRGLRREGWDILHIEAPGGKLDLEQLERALTEKPTTLITIMRVQNEVGYVFPSAEVAVLRDKLAPDAVFHVDAVQAFCKLDVAPREWGADLLTVASHKIHGPRGIGALYVREGLKMFTTAFGGGQERGLRSGTEPVFLAAGFARAVQLAQAKHEESLAQVRRLREYAARELSGAIPGLIVNSPEDASPYILSISVPGVPNGRAVAALSDAGVYVSRASACESNHLTVEKGTWRKKHPLSLQAAGIPLWQGNTTLRVSFGRENTTADIDALVSALSTFASGWRAAHPQAKPSDAEDSVGESAGPSVLEVAS